jgi:hypothetical protein
MHKISIEEKHKRQMNLLVHPRNMVPEALADKKKRSLESKRGRRNSAQRIFASDIEQQTDLKKLLEQRVLDSQMEFSLQELLSITKKEFHELIIDLVKRKRHVLEEVGHLKINTNTIFMSDIDNFDVPDSHYANKHWAHATTETPVQIGNVKEPVITLFDHGSEINLMSRDFYRKGKWHINTNHGWRL